MLKMLRLQLLPFSLLSLLVVASAAGTTTAPKYTNTSSIASKTGCNSCTVTAFETFLTYPSSVETTKVPLTATVIPLVTVHADGSRETNYKTVTASANVTASYKPVGDPFAQLTWVVDSATLTYPTTYVSFFGLSGGLFTPSLAGAATTCVPDVEPLQLPATYAASNLIAPVTVSIDLRNPTGVSAPPQVMTFLNGIPAVSSQFSGTDVAKCSWTKIPKSFATLTATEIQTGVATVQKVTVAVLTEVTAAQQVITAPAGGGANQATTATVPPPVVHTEDSATGDIVNPAPTNNPTPQPEQQPQPTTAPNLFADIGSAIVGGSTGGDTNGNGGTQAPANTGSGPATQGGQNGGQGGTITANGAAPTPLVVNVGGQQTTVAPTIIAGPQGSGSVTAFVLGPGTTLTAGGPGLTLPASVVGGVTFPATVITAPQATGAATGPALSPLVVTIGGKATTFLPTIITGAQGPVTGFVLGPGTTLLPGGSAVVISGTTISGSAFAGTTLSLSNVSGSTSKGSATSTSKSSSSATSTTTGGVGGAIASGLGITSAPASTGAASHRGVDLPIWCLGVIFGSVGALAVWL